MHQSDDLSTDIYSSRTPCTLLLIVCSFSLLHPLRRHHRRLVHSCLQQQLSSLDQRVFSALVSCEYQLSVTWDL